VRIRFQFVILGINYRQARAPEGFFPGVGGAVGDFPKIFFQGGPKVVKFVFYPSKLKKQPFLANNFKIQG